MRDFSHKKTFFLSFYGFFCGGSRFLFLVAMVLVGLAETCGETTLVVRLSETSDKSGGETGPPLANSPSMHSRVIHKDPKTPFFFFEKCKNHCRPPEKNSF